MAELSAVPFSALPQAGDGYTVLYEDNQVCRSEKKLSELVGDKTSSFLTKEQGDSLYQEKGNYLVADDITGKLDKSQYAVDSATFLTAHQDISNKLDTTAFSTVSGDFLTDEDITGKMDKSESANFYPMTGNPSGFLTQQSLDEYATQEWVNDQGFLKEHQPISADEWNDVYETVVSNSGTWETETDWTDDINDASAYAYEQAIAQIPAPFDPTFLSGEIDKKLDKTFSSNFYPMTGNPSGFITGIPTSSNWDSVYSTVNTNSGTWNNVSAKVDTTAMSAYYKKTETSSKEEIYNEFNATSAWANVTFQPIGDYLSANALKDLSGKWESASDKVNDSAAIWNTVTAKADQTDLETLSSNVEKLSADVETISSNLDKKLNTQDFNAWSATIDTAFYSAGEGLALDNHTFSISAKYLSANALNNLSGRWENASVYAENNSANFENLSATVKSNSANWNEVSSKANSADLTALSSKVNNLSGELNTTSSFLSGAIESVSAEFEKVVYTSATANWDVINYSAGQNINITDHTISGKDWTGTIKESSANAVTTVENKFNGENNTITAYGTSSFANDKYTAGEGLALNDHQFYVSGKYITSAGDSLAGKMLVLKDNEWMEMPEFGGFATANSGAGHPDVQNPSTKLIYLVKNSSVTGNDKYSEWIYTSAEQTTAWECIGETTLDLTDYYKKTETSGASEISDAFNAKQDKLTAGTDIVINNEVIGVNTNGSAIGDFAFVEGKNTFAGGLCDHVEGMGGIADNGGMNHIEGFQYHSYCSNRPVTNFNNTNIVKFPNVCPVILRNNERISPNGTLYELVKIFKDRFIVSCDYGGGDGAGIYHYTQNPFYNPELYKIIDVDLDSSTNEILITIDGTINVPGSSNGFIQLYGPTTINSINGTGGSLSSGQTLNTFIFNGGLGFPGNCLDNVRLDNTFISINLGYTKTGEQEQTTISKIIEIKNIEFDSSNNSFTFTTEDIEIPDIVGGGYTLALYVINSTYNGCNHIEGQDNSINYGCNSHAEGFCNTITNNCSHVEGSFNYASNSNSHAEGNSTSACGSCSHTEGKETFVYTNASNSHAEGYQSSAYAVVSHAEGSATLAAGSASHSEGFNTLASAQYSHAEGYKTTAIYYAHAEGWETRANEGGHAEGRKTFAGGQYSHAEGQETKALTNNAHSEGGYTSAGGYCSHAEGQSTIASGAGSHSEGGSTTAYFISHAEGSQTLASGTGAHSEGNMTKAYNTSHAEGNMTIASGEGAHAEGGYTKANGQCAHAEGLETYTYASNEGAHAEGYKTSAVVGRGAHSEGWNTIASGWAAHAEGNNTSALSSYTHSEGSATLAAKAYAHAEGLGTTANYCSHSEGHLTYASGDYSHTEGQYTSANSDYSHAEGLSSRTISGTDTLGASHAEGIRTSASGQGSHSEGSYTLAQNEAAHAEGYYTTANGYGSHSEGNYTSAYGQGSHSEGSYTTAFTLGAHAEGGKTKAIGSYAHAEGSATSANSNCSHAEGQITKAVGAYTHAEGLGTIASSMEAHAEGNNTRAIGICSHAEGSITSAAGNYSHAEGSATSAGKIAHAEGCKTSAFGNHSHSEGANTISTGANSHSEGDSTSAIGSCSHSEGYKTSAVGSATHSEGFETSAVGNYSHSNGYYTIANNSAQFVCGKYNDDVEDSLFLIGNGEDTSARSNAFIVTNEGLASATNMMTSAGYVVTDVIITSATNSSTSFVTNGVADLTPLYTYIKSLEDRIAALEAAQGSDGFTVNGVQPTVNGNTITVGE